MRHPAVSLTGASGGSSGGGGGAPGYVDSPSVLSFRGGSSYWGSETLPPNASLSNFSSFSGVANNDSHFFSAGASAFSFEGGPASAGAYWDGSYRSSVTGSPSIFDDSRPSPFLLRQATNDSSPLNPRTLSSDGSASTSAAQAASAAPQQPVALWDLPQSSSSRSSGPSYARTSSPVGGGRKPKEASRRLRYSVATVSRDKGLVGLAKPHRDAEQGRVAVAGKTCLKLLKVPHGGNPSGPPTAVPSPVSASYRSSSIAYRRSRSRGSPATADRIVRDGSVGRIDEEQEREEVSELMDVRLGSRLGPAYLFSDVRWGYGATANKLATSFTNGAVVLWDLAKEGGSRLDQLKYEHDRAVNRVVFGGLTGNWLMSGGQDGQMKLWDIRDAKPANMILKASSPPFTVLAACASGTLIRYDVRYISRQNGGATDRIAGHVGSCLAMDWRDGFSCERDTAGGGREGGWVVTGGVDRTIKVWDFSLATLSTKPVRTLYTSQPVSVVAWHPTRATELASGPMPSLGVAATGEGSASSLGDEPPTTPVSGGDGAAAAFVKGEPAGRARFVDGNAWKNEIEVWDHDAAADSYSLLDSIDRPSTTWNLEGELAFIEDGRRLNDIPFERPSRSMPPVDSEKFRPDAFVHTISDIDPDFSPDSFAYLANNLEVEGKFTNVCTQNAQACAIANRPDASQVWMVLRTWFDDDEAFFPPDSPPPTPSPPPEQQRRSSGVVHPSTQWPTSPSSQHHAEHGGRDSSAPRSGRPSFSSVMGSRRSSADVTPQLVSTSSAGTPLEGPTRVSTLDVFSEESTASESDPSDQPAEPDYPELSTTSSESEDDPSARASKLNPTRLAASLGALRAKSKESRRSRSRSSTVGSDAHGERGKGLKHMRSGSRLASRRNSSSSSSGSDLDDVDDEPVRDGIRRTRSAKIASMHASMHASFMTSRSRRPSSGAGASAERRPLRSRESTLPRASSRQQSMDPTSTSRRGSVQASGHASRLHSVDGGSAGSLTRKRAQDPPRAPTAEELNHEAGLAHAIEAREVVKKQLVATLREYADRGDAQLKDVELEPLWVARVTKTYIDLLRRLNVHVAAAKINKYCTTQSLRDQTQMTQCCVW
ncbi:hypothetical protein Rhopal_005186-T1 [Rhodotorula paludigena]|uniref:Uncharacterized protein n=1 Tax=Rhodotorula paludigena TaxID=86838 RepID=A0AAV5GRM0_9BASI|nr:hypothetical protein Rhopal_005186-T1 [Rhodotorula paludigena]